MCRLICGSALPRNSFVIFPSSSVPAIVTLTEAKCTQSATKFAHLTVLLHDKGKLAMDERIRLWIVCL